MTVLLCYTQFVRLYLAILIGGNKVARETPTITLFPLPHNEITAIIYRQFLDLFTVLLGRATCGKFFELWCGDHPSSRSTPWNLLVL